MHKIWRRRSYDQNEHWHALAASFFPPSATVLDVGCGRGAFLKHVKGRGIGLDWNAESIEAARDGGHKIIAGDVRNIPLEDASVDGVYCSHVIEHFVPSDVHRILSEMDRVLKPGGTLVICSPLLWNGFYCDLTHVKPYYPQAILHYLAPRWRQNTLSVISEQYRVVCLKWRYKSLPRWIPVIGAPLADLNRWGFPWLKKTGYMLVMKKEDRETTRQGGME